MKEMIAKLYDWNFWGNRSMLTMMHDNGGATGRMLDLFSHILAAEQIWLTRLHGEESSNIEVFPQFSEEQCAKTLDKNEKDWNDFFDELPEDKLTYLLHYTNQYGVENHSAVADILLHVNSHGHYHRGQIATAAREAGWKPVNTDYITYTRLFSVSEIG